MKYFPTSGKFFPLQPTLSPTGLNRPTISLHLVGVDPPCVVPALVSHYEHLHMRRHRKQSRTDKYLERNCSSHVIEARYNNEMNAVTEELYSTDHR